MKGYQFTIPGQPIPKGRPRSAPGQRPFTPKATRDYERTVAILAKTAGVQPLRGRVGIQLRFFRISRIRADWDNLSKCVTDGLNGIAYADDVQIHHVVVTKDYDPECPRCEVRVWEIAETALEAT